MFVPAVEIDCRDYCGSDYGVMGQALAMAHRKVPVLGLDSGAEED